MSLLRSFLNLFEPQIVVSIYNQIFVNGVSFFNMDCGFKRTNPLFD